MDKRVLLHATLAAAIAMLPAARIQAQIPDTFTNLQLLDETIEKAELVSVMRGWAGVLGVRCNHCHVGPDNLDGMDFASDEKATKRTARRMIAMTRAINQELLADLPVVEPGESPVEVTCYTCHRGQTKPPEDIRVELLRSSEIDGVEAALARYDTLREEHYGTAAYDLSVRTLTRLAQALMEAGRFEDAIRALEHNLKHFPDSAFSQAMIGWVHFEAQRPEEAKAAFEKALEMDPDLKMAERGLAALAAGPEGGGG